MHGRLGRPNQVEVSLQKNIWGYLLEKKAEQGSAESIGEQKLNSWSRIPLPVRHAFRKFHAPIDNLLENKATLSLTGPVAHLPTLCWGLDGSQPTPYSHQQQFLVMLHGKRPKYHREIVLWIQQSERGQYKLAYE